VADGKLNRPCRIYAPVGTHETLLAYLVRRLLENGANTSFVNRIADNTLPLDELVADPVSAVEKLAQQEGQAGLPHPKIPLPRDLYGSGRSNSAGLDLANEHRLASLSSSLLNSALHKWQALPMLEQPVAEGEVGHLLTRGPYTIRGYHNDAVANARSFTDDGFYRTGDRVQQLPGGYLVVQGRAGDHINRAGEKISAEEIEDHLLAHPGVFDAAVVSIPDEYLGERSCAFVIPQGEPFKAPALKSWMRGRGLAAFKVPDQVVLVDSFDTTAVGKISRRELRAQLRARHLQQTGGTR